MLLTAVVALIFFSSISQRYFGHVMADPDLDFHDYYFAAQVIHADPHASLYYGAMDGNPQLRSAPKKSPIARIAQRDGFPDTELYLYPPLLADLLSPLTHLSLSRAAQAWRAMNLLIVFLSLWMLATLLRMPRLSSGFAVLVAVAYGFWPVHEAVSLGQITPVLLCLWTFGIFAYVNEMPMLSAFAFALATAFKLTPVLLVLPFLLWKEWRWLVSYCTSLLAMFAVMFAWNGFANMLAFAHVVLTMGGILPSLQNKCLGSVLSWLYYGHIFTLASVHTVINPPVFTLQLVTNVADAAFYGACLLLAWRRERRSIADHRALLIAIFGMATLIIAPVSWRHGYTITLIPFAMLWVNAVRRSMYVTKLWLLAISSIAVGSLIFDLAAQTPLPQPIKILCGAVWPLSCALLCLVSLFSAEALKLAGDTPSEQE